jgi:hypothetical protein
MMFSLHAVSETEVCLVHRRHVPSQGEGGRWQVPFVCSQWLVFGAGDENISRSSGLRRRNLPGADLLLSRRIGEDVPRR